MRKEKYIQIRKYKKTTYLTVRFYYRSQYNYRLYQYAIRVMYHTGVRPSECYALQRSDVDLDKYTLRIKSRVGSTTEASSVVVPTKTEASARIVPLTAAAASVFASLLEFVPVHLSAFTGTRLEPVKKPILSGFSHVFGFLRQSGKSRENDQVVNKN